jgi:hypothetical protein
MSPVYLAHSLVVYWVESHYKRMKYVYRRHVISLPYTLQENEVSKPETCDFSTLYITYRIEK